MLPVLLAAGAGRRLGSQVKALYPLDGLPLMHRAALVPAHAGFGRLLALNKPHTVAVACEHADDGDLLILDSDIVFTGEVLQRLTNAPEALTLAVDDSTVDGQHSRHLAADASG